MDDKLTVVTAQHRSTSFSFMSKRTFPPAMNLNQCLIHNGEIELAVAKVHINCSVSKYFLEQERFHFQIDIFLFMCGQKLVLWLFLKSFSE